MVDWRKETGEIRHPKGLCVPCMEFRVRGWYIELYNRDAVSSSVSVRKWALGLVADMLKETCEMRHRTGLCACCMEFHVCGWYMKLCRDALCIQVSFRKWALWLVADMQKEICEMKHRMGLCVFCMEFRVCGWCVILCIQALLLLPVSLRKSALICAKSLAKWGILRVCVFAMEFLCAWMILSLRSALPHEHGGVGYWWILHISYQ